MKYQVLLSIAVMAAAASVVYGQTTIGGVAYEACPAEYPNNNIDNGSCFCSNDAGEQIPCVVASGAAATATDVVATDAARVGPVALALSACLGVFALFLF